MQKDDNALVKIRKREGYETAKAFAEALGIPYTTYQRYEADPDKMPASAVCAVADLCDLTADEVIGRVPADARDLTVQNLYDRLTMEGRELMGQLMGVVAERDAAIKKQAAYSEVQRYAAIARYYRRELLAVADVDERWRDRVLFGTPADRRAAFEEFVGEKVQKRMDAAAEEAADARAAEMGDVDMPEHMRSELVSEEIEKRRVKAEVEIRRIMYGYDEDGASLHGPVEAALIEFV